MGKRMIGNRQTDGKGRVEERGWGGELGGYRKGESR